MLSPAVRIRFRPGPVTTARRQSRCDALRWTARGWVRCLTASHRVLQDGHRVCRRCHIEALQAGLPWDAVTEERYEARAKARRR